MKTLAPVASTFFTKLKQWRIVRGIYLQHISEEEGSSEQSGRSIDRSLTFILSESVYNSM